MGLTKKHPTRYSETRDSCIDLVCSNSDCISKAVVCNVNLSDHEMIFFTRKRIKLKQEKISFTGRSYKSYDKHIFTETLLNQNSEKFETQTDPGTLWDTIVENITNSINPMCPLKRFTVRMSEKPWFTNEILEQIQDKDRALKRAKKKTGKSDDWKLAKRLRNDCLATIRGAKSNVIQNELNTNWNDSKKFWQHVNTILPQNSDRSLIKLNDNGHPLDKDEVPDFINDYFSNIGPKLAETLNEPWVYNGMHSENQLPDIVTNEDEVKSLIKDIDISKASAIKNLSTK